MSALPWAIPAVSAVALGLLRLVSREHARAALTAVAVLWAATTLFVLPILLTRS